MNTVLQEFFHFIFNNTDIFRLEASIHPDNSSSINLAPKLGFEIEGTKKKCDYNNSTKVFEDRVIMGLTNN